MACLLAQIRRGAYADSIVLMQLQAALAAEPGVEDAGAVMATPANLDLLRANGLLHPEAEAARPDDLAVVVRAGSEAEARAALERIDELMVRRGGGEEGDFRPRTLRSAARLLPEAGWVVISVPGRYAAEVARDALELGKHVFLYSDNVSTEDEIELKREAGERGLLVMGPDCGTAIVGGVGLGFANRVRRGTIGLVGASGTGLQAVSCGIHRLGGGVSHALGTGGRDLGREVGGATASRALDLLARDDATRAIVLVSKPPDPRVAARLLAQARAVGKPVVVLFLGYAPPARRVGDLHFALDSGEAAAWAVRLAEEGAGVSGSEARTEAEPSLLRGLFAGGTLAYEAQIGLRGTLYPIYSNAPILDSRPLEDAAVSVGHTVLDLGADELTVGRPHPMIDPELRLRRLRREAEDPEVGVILLDVVLGDGAHSDPAETLASAIGEALRRPDLEIVTVLVGTDQDPQDLDSQRQRLAAAGAVVVEDLPAGLERVRRTLAPPAPAAPEVALDALARPAALCVGVEVLFDSLVRQGVPAVQLDWRPPAGGDERMAGLLRRFRGR